MGEAGLLAALIPEEYGGSGLPLSTAAAILEEVHASGCNGGACHAQMYTMGIAAAARQLTRRSSAVAAEDRLRRGAVCRHSASPSRPRRAPTRYRSLKTFAKKDGNNGYIVNGQKIWTSRAEHSDLMILLARTTPKDEVGETHRRSVGLSSST